MGLLTKEEKEMLPLSLNWEKTESADEFTYYVEAYDKETRKLYTGSCDKGEYDILEWKYANLREDIYVENDVIPLN